MPNQLDERLQKCFEIVFPHLSQDDVRLASTSTVKEWDSVAAITLVAVIEEEFQLAIDFEQLPSLNSYGAVRSYLAHQE